MLNINLAYYNPQWTRIDCNIRDHAETKTFQEKKYSFKNVDSRGN